MKKLFCFLAVALLFSASAGYANNLAISNFGLVGQNAGSHYVMVQFDVSWDNSWRTSNLNGDGVTNWDAAYLFVKYKKTSDGLWYHATLNTTATHSTGSQGVSATITPLSTAKGAFFYRTGNGTGAFSSTTVQLRWQYGTDGLTDNLDADVSDVRIFGIEMVYVPQGSFSAGSGGSESAAFRDGSGTNNPWSITSESAITTDNNAGPGGYRYVTSGQGGESATGSVFTIPAGFPKGYNAFYSMKYEITQEQYVAFLNTLTYTQQSNRVDNAPSSAPGTYAFTGGYRNGIQVKTSGTNNTVPATFACNLNNNGTYNEVSDGQNIACNNLSWADGAAYSDWSGLRPMTELEFEKASRGTAPAVADEYAWGNTTIQEATSISNSGASNESPGNGAANCIYNHNGSVQGPMRVGSCTSGSRASMGASYYGIMEMSGNLWERPVTVGNSTGRSFDGLNGDGILDASGNADTSNWPGTNAVGSGFRGGSWIDISFHCRVSDRNYAAYTLSGRSDRYGFRCIAGLY